MIDLQFLQKLADLLNSSGVGSIEVKKNFWSTTVRMSKGEPHANPSTPPAVQGAGGRGLEGVRSARGTGVEDVESAVAEPPPPPPSPAPAVDLIDIKSPMVGTFYAQPEPGAEHYVELGSTISPGTTLCIIEAMKIMNPIDAEVSGVIREVLVQDAQPVEFGQVLFKVDPNG